MVACFCVYHVRLVCVSVCVVVGVVVYVLVHFYGIFVCECVFVCESVCVRLFCTLLRIKWYTLCFNFTEQFSPEHRCPNSLFGECYY